jgi:lipoate-protein ligase A
LRYAEQAPLRNMALDAALLAAAPIATLRLYGWAPHAVSLGYFQDDAEAARARGAGMPLVRRMTGGGAIVHAHEVTYSLVLPEDHPALRGCDVKASYAVMHAPIRAALAAFGVATEVRAEPVGSRAEQSFLCFARATELDLVADGRKIVGSAQRRRPGRILQHGSILLEDHPWQPGTASVAAISGRRPAPALFALVLEREFAAVFGPAVTGALTPEEEFLAERTDEFRGDLPRPKRAS